MLENNILSGAKSLLLKNSPYLVLGGSIGIAIYFIFATLLDTKGNKASFKEVTKSVNAIQTKIDSLNSNQTFLIDRMYQVEEKQAEITEAITENTEVVKKTNREINKLKQIYNEKVTRVDGYNYNQLDSFFSKRYKQQQ